MQFVIRITLITLIVWYLPVSVKALPCLRDTTLRLDTININGVVYGHDGKPAQNIAINLFTAGVHVKQFATLTHTNQEGQFKLLGVSPNDKIQILEGDYAHVLFPINGSRYIVIYLPQAKISNATFDTVKIRALRTKPKKVPAFEQKTSTEGFAWDNHPGIKYPQFSAGVKFKKVLTDSILYPQKAIENTIEGLVEIGFKINKKGDPIDFVIYKGVGYGCEEQVISSIKRAGKWLPGIINGKYFSNLQTVSVQFTLTGK